jgi:hypothetical protein
MPDSRRSYPRPGNALEPDEALEPVNLFKYQMGAFDTRELREEQNTELLKQKHQALPTDTNIQYRQI